MKKLFSILFFSLIFFPLYFVSAQDATPQLDNPLGSSVGANSPQAFVGGIINSILGIVGSIALIMFIYGGIIWMTSSGSAEKVKKARDIVIWSALGLVIVFVSYGLVRFLIVTINGQ